MVPQNITGTTGASWIQVDPITISSSDIIQLMIIFELTTEIVS